ncbi:MULTISPECIES: hypothetical protein [Lysinibacillus]|uniref:Restriction endonuclease type IV Mrr domain-containing protein n=1 Tax=Lysinibacillus xylanilyticus TaxID=582475 RepID=A0ABV3W511_9BACI
MVQDYQWFLIELTFPDDINICVNDIKRIFEDNIIKYKWIIKSTVILDNDNAPSEKEIAQLYERFCEYISDKDSIVEEFDLTYYKANEIMFNLDIKDSGMDEEEFISQLARISDSEIEEYDSEANLIKKVDYAEDTYSKKPLLHNIRCENIAIFTLKTLNLGVAFIGYMKFKDSLKITIKVFNFDLLKYLTENIDNLFKNIEWEDNIDWKLLLSRKVSKGYRENKKHISQNSLMQSFLKMTKSKDNDGKIRFLLKNLLDKGYLTEDNYIEIAKLSNITRFIQRYNRIIKNNLRDTSLWIDTSLGVVFKENDRANPERIQQMSLVENIYAPPQHLLHYIRAYWHQDYVESIFEVVKEKINTNQEDIKIVEMITDYQFDLIRTGQPTKSSRDIDLLLRLRNIKNASEFIIAVEAKRNASEFKSVKNDIVQKISARYADIFTGFVAVAYFEKSGDELDESIVRWGEDDNIIEKTCVLCASNEIDKIEEKIINAINRICI